MLQGLDTDSEGSELIRAPRAGLRLPKRGDHQEGLQTGNSLRLGLGSCRASQWEQAAQTAECCGPSRQLVVARADKATSCGHLAGLVTSG